MDVPNEMGNVLGERYTFFQRCQMANENFYQFLDEIRHLAKHCEFAELEDSLIRDRLVFGANSVELRDRILNDGGDPPLDVIIQICSETESRNIDALHPVEELLLKADANIVCDIKVEYEDIDDSYPHDNENLDSWTEPMPSNTEYNPTATPSYRCKVCERLYYHSESLSRHLYHDHVSNLKCLNCDTIFETTKELRNHMGTYREYATTAKNTTTLTALLSKISPSDDSETVDEDSNLSVPDTNNISRVVSHADETGVLQNEVAKRPREETTYMCTICKRTYNLYYSLTRHLYYDHTNRKKMKCLHCNVKHENFEELKEHMKSAYLKKIKLNSKYRNENKVKIEEIVYGCKICECEFMDKYSAPRHILDHHCDKIELKCSTCLSTFLSADDLRWHTRQHISKNKKTMEKYICEICNKRFSQFSTYERHVRSHSFDSNVKEKPKGIELIECEYCELKFVKKVLYRQHLRTHTKDTKFSCNICKRTCLSAANLARHQQRHVSLFCELCQRSFTKRYTFNSHMEVHQAKLQMDANSSAIRKYQCFICKKSFLTYQRTKVHMKSHNRRPCLCTVCGKIFQTSTTWKYHMETHSERKLECPHCDKTFQTSSGLKEHLSKHTGRLRFKCTDCDRAYDIRGHLEKHVDIVHRNIRYDCHRCPMKFTSKQSLKKHQITHTGEFPYKCAHCSNEYRNKFNLRVHSRKYHDVEI